MMKLKNKLNASVLRLYAIIMLGAHKIPKEELRPLIEELEAIRDEL